MATTALAPISAGQVNGSFYVSADALPTIQEAIDYARIHNGGVGKVVIEEGYGGSETIASLTGGTADIFIKDERNAQMQIYQWSGSAYVPTSTSQLGGFIAHGVPPIFPGSINMGYDPNGTAGNGSGDLVVAGNDATKQPGFNLILEAGDGSGFHTFIRADASGATPLLKLPEDVDVTGSLTATGTLSAAAASFTALSANNATISGDVTAATVHTPSLTITNAHVTGTLTLDNDPTQPQQGATKHYVDEAIAESGNFVYPGPGVTTSTGSAWGTPINPADLPRLSAAANPFAGNASFASLHVGDRTQLQTNTKTFPSVAADTANIVLDAAPSGGIFMNWENGSGTAGLNLGDGKGNRVGSVDGTGAASFAGSCTAGGLGIAPTGGPLNLPGAGTIRVAGPDMLFSPPTGALFLNWDSGPNGVWFGDGAGHSVGRIPANGVARFNGGLQIGPTGNLASIDGTGTLSLAGSASVNGGVASTSFFASGMSQIPAQGTFRLGYDTATGYLDAFGPNSATRGSMHFRVLSGDTSSYIDALDIDSDGTTNVNGNLKCDQLMSRTNGWLLLNRDSGTAVVFGNGAGGTVGSVDNVGNATFSGHFGITGNAAGSYTVPSCASMTWNITNGGGETDFCNGGGGGFYWYSPAAGTVLNSGSVPLMNLDAGGMLHTTGGKAFKITHPLDDTKYLIHACIEGPELAVYYRGEAETAGGSAEVTLPDYFEALTRPDGRTVQLTQIFESDEEELVALAASRVVGGKFRIRSRYPNVKVCWEVKAVRADIAPLAVVTDKE